MIDGNPRHGLRKPATQEGQFLLTDDYAAILQVRVSFFSLFCFVLLKCQFTPVSFTSSLLLQFRLASTFIVDRILPEVQNGKSSTTDVNNSKPKLTLSSVRIIRLNLIILFLQVYSFSKLICVILCKDNSGPLLILYFYIEHCYCAFSLWNRLLFLSKSVKHSIK